MRRLVLALFLVAVAGCGTDEPATVSMTDGQRFEPVVLEVPVGTSVRFSNDSDEAHTVTAYEGAIPDDARYFASGVEVRSEEEAREKVARSLLPPGTTFFTTFMVPGTYEYFCIPHEAAGMKGTITVTP